jgi:hypothetical protein
MMSDPHVKLEDLGALWGFQQPRTVQHQTDAAHSMFYWLHTALHTADVSIVCAYEPTGIAPATFALALSAHYRGCPHHKLTWSLEVAPEGTCI